MRCFLGLLLLLCVSTVSAETFRCIGPSGRIVFSDIPCDDGERFSKILPSESVQDADAARRELERQKGYAERAAAENEAARRSTGGVASLPEESSPTSESSSGLSFPGAGGGSGSGSGSGVGGGSGAGPEAAAGTGSGPGSAPRGGSPPVSHK